jgi:hypothetical protein
MKSDEQTLKELMRTTSKNENKDNSNELSGEELEELLRGIANQLGYIERKDKAGENW